MVFMGALTSKPYAFNSRPWELVESAALDFLDTCHSPLQLSTRGSEVLRVVPDLRYSSLNEWVSDRARFSYDSLVVSNRAVGFKFFFDNSFYSFKPSHFFLDNFIFYRFASFNLIAIDFLSDELLGTLESFFARVGLPAFQPAADFSITPASFSTIFNASSSARFSSVVICGLSIRYTHPVLVAVLRQFQVSSNYSFFDFGDPLAFSTYSFGSSLRNFFNAFRFKARFSGYLKNSALITSSRVFGRFPNFFPFDRSVVLSEFVQTSALSSLAFKPSFSSFDFTSAFASYFLPTEDFIFGTPHPFESGYSFSHSASVAHTLVSSPAVLPAVATYDFFSSALPEKSKTAGLWSTLCFPAFNLAALSFHPVFHSSFFSAYNHFDHFFGSAYTRYSSNILLTLRRNDDYRHSHFYSF